MRGRKPKMTAPKAPLAAIPAAPSYLSKVGKAEWRRVVRILVIERKTLTEADLPILGNYCAAFGIMCEASRILNAEGLVLGDKRHPAFSILNNAQTTHRLCAAELGLTPVSRSRPAVREDEDDEDLGALFGDG